MEKVRDAMWWVHVSLAAQDLTLVRNLSALRRALKAYPDAQGQALADYAAKRLGSA